MTALSGMRVLDMTQYEAGPAATQALAWLGADVVKVERPGTGDPGRGVAGTPDSSYFINWNCNKRSVTIDLDRPEGRRLLLEMVPHYDVFVENYGPGVVERLDIGYEVMRAVHPAVIYARIKGFGTSGPYAGYKCFDMVAQAASGAFSITGAAEGPPMRPGPTLADSGTGVQLALAITAAYVQRLQTGSGQLIELSMQEAMTYFMRTAISTGADWGRQAAPRTGNGYGAMMNLYPCRDFGPNDYVYIMVMTPRMWETLARTIGRADLLEDSELARSRGRRENAESLYQEIEKWTRQRTKAEAMRELGEAGVPCSAVLDTRDLFRDPHLMARGFIKTIEHPTQGRLPLMGWPAQLSESEVEIAASPLLGQHTDEVLSEDLGLDEEAIRRLRESGAVD